MSTILKVLKDKYGIPRKNDRKADTSLWLTNTWIHYKQSESFGRAVKAENSWSRGPGFDSCQSQKKSIGSMDVVG